MPSIARLMDTMFTGPGHPVDRALREGDEVAGFRVIDAPGHSRGHIALFRESDRVLILGDVLNSADPLTGMRGLRLLINSQEVTGRDSVSSPMKKTNLTRREIFRGKVSLRKNQPNKTDLEERTQPAP